MLNKVTLIGTLDSEPVQREYDLDIVATFSMVTTQEYVDTRGYMKKSTNSVRVTCHGHQASEVLTHLRAESLVYVEGRIETYTSKLGHRMKRHTVNIQADKVVFLYIDEDSLMEYGIESIINRSPEPPEEELW